MSNVLLYGNGYHVTDNQQLRKLPCWPTLQRVETVSKPGYRTLGKPFCLKEYEQTQSRRQCAAHPLPQVTAGYENIR
jgi:hypothetical protein